MFKGFLSFGGTELANAERTATYIRHAIPSFGLQEEYAGCEYLAEALGDQPYSSPMSDTAPWFSPYNEPSADFYGLIPLAIDGLEDGTREAPVTEATFDGAIIGMARNASRQVRVRALAAAADERSMDAGMSWLRNALEGSGCSEGNCDGDDLCWLVDCPEPCDYSGSPIDILDIDMRGLSRDEQVALALDSFDFAPDTLFNTPFVTGTYVEFRREDEGFQPWASRVMTDLVPGAVYRVDVGYSRTAATFAPGIAISVPGASEPVTPLQMYQADSQSGIVWNKGGDRATFEFVAQSSVHRLLIEGLLAAGTGIRVYDTIRLIGVTVRRMPRRSIVLASMVSPVDDPGQARAWTVTNPTLPNLTNLTMYHGRYYLEYTLSSTIGTPVAVAANKAYIGRPVSGLTIGRRYRAVAMIRSVATGPNAGVRPAVSADGGATWSSPYDLPIQSSVGSTARLGWIEHEFTATSRSQNFLLGNGDALSILAGASGNFWNVGVMYLRVEEIVDGLPYEQSDPVDPLRRSLRGVTCISGPTQVREYDKKSGVIREIEFIFQAGDPRPFGSEIEVPSVLGPGSIYVPQEACFYGQPERINHWPNPKAVSTAGWTALNLGANFTFTAVDSTNFAGIATRAFRLTCVTSTPDPSPQPRLQYNATGLSDSAMYSLSMYMYTNAVQVPGANPNMWTPNVFIYLNATSPGGGQEQIAVDLDNRNVVGGRTGYRIGTSVFLPSGRDGILVDMQFYSGRAEGWLAGDFVEFSGILLESGQVQNVYFDGDSKDSAWLGATGLSASRYRKTSAPLVVDPDCVIIPSPPRPPIITNPCITDPSRWLRYSTDIPDWVTQSSSAGAPVVSLTSGAAAVRGARVRFQANPNGYGWEELNACDYCGEFIASYIPPNSTLTINALERTATLIVSGQEQTAMHLLYGTDGGPVVWPELECGIRYTMLVDLDSGTAPLVDLNLAIVPTF